MSSSPDRTTDLIRHHWDHRAISFDEEPGHGLVSDEQRRAWLDLLSSLAGPSPQRVLDVGCGTGFLATRFAELGHNVTGIDLAPRMIDQARHKAEETHLAIDFRTGDAADLRFADDTFDLVVARHVIWNLPDPERGLREWLRVLRPGGRLALIEGKWADNAGLERSYARPTSRLFARLIDLVAAFVTRIGARPTKLLNWKYRRVEVQLPFSGGPSATRLAQFLEANSVQHVKVEPLMDPALWGETPQFERYLATGIRPPHR
jgi:ubiquinone/menaquinone biosynthesis C-methylase UbiE